MMSRSDSIGDSLDAKPGSSSSSAVAVADQNQEPDDAHAPSLFEEADEATQIISYLIDALNNNKYGSVGYKKVELPGDSDDPGVWTRTGAEEEAKSARVRNIFQKYQEQPHLLDPFLARTVNPAASALRDIIVSAYDKDHAEKDDGRGKEMEAVVMDARVHQLLEVLYTICSVRGSKVVVRLFTNAPSDLSPLLAFFSLLPGPQSDYRPWTSRYVILLWLSLVVMVPFDLATIGAPGLLSKIVETCKDFFGQATGKDGEGAALLLARVLGRADAVGEDGVEGVLGWCQEVFAKEGRDGNVYLCRNALNALCLLLKHSLRSHLLPYLDTFSSILFTLVPAEQDDESAPKKDILKSQVLGKLLVKYTGRLGEVLLPPKVVNLGKSGSTLVGNLQKQQATAGTKRTFEETETTSANIATEQPEEEEEEDTDVPEALEPLLALLLSQLAATSSVVRWVAAKALSRITSRLPSYLSSQIIESALDNFSANVLPAGAAPDDADLSQCSEAAWQGTLLFLASLIRAHALSAELIATSLPWVLRALTFDHRRGSQIVGIGVRDAGCYVLWALARSRPFALARIETHEIGRRLVCTALFDREINVRRAASAAFQEGVGRFKGEMRYLEGIDVLRAIDFWSIGSARNSYGKVMEGVARFEDYRQPILSYLLRNSIGHWDILLRTLASTALARLVVIDEAQVLGAAWQGLLESARDIEVSKRHGSILAVAELVLAVGTSASSSDDLGTPGSRLLLDAALPQLEQTTPTSDMLLSAYVRLIECLALGNWTLDDTVLSRAHHLVSISLVRKSEALQRAAAKAFGALVARRPDSLTPERLTKLEEGVLPRKDDSAGLGFVRRRGYAMALGQLPGSAIVRFVTTVVEALVAGMGSATNKETGRTTYLRNTVAGEAEAKSECVASLVAVFEAVVASYSEGAQADVDTVAGKVLAALLNGLSDYSVDSRGDVGSWVREASMRGLSKTVRLLCNLPSGVVHRSWNSEQARDVVAGILQQSVEKIDRVRVCAGSALNELLEDETLRGILPGSAKLRATLLAEPSIAWGNSADVFSRTMPLLHLSEYRIDLLRGIATSIGGLTESLVRHASDGFVSFLGTVKEGLPTEKDGGATLDDILYSLLTLFRVSASEERLIVSLLQTYHLVLTSGFLGKLSSDRHEYFKTVVHLAVREIRRSRDPKKIMAGVNVVTGFLSLHDERQTVKSDDHHLHHGPEWKQMALTNSLGFLLHGFPRIRKHAAEQLYLVLSALDMEQQLAAVDLAGPDEDETMPQNDVATVDQSEDLVLEEASSFATSIEPLLLETDWDKPIEELKPLVKDELEPSLRKFLGMV